MPDKVRAYSGTLPMRDAHEEMADARLSVTEGLAAPVNAPSPKGSPYRESFRCGATLFPRMLCFVEHKTMGRLGPNPNAPMVVSKRSPLEKSPWKNLDTIENQVEAEFIRPIFLGESILPYRVLHAFEGIVPISETFEALDSAAANHELRQHSKLAEWMKKAEKLWSENAASDSMTLIGRWNYQRGLTNQFPIPPIRVVYAASGSQPAAVIVRDEQAVIEHKLYWATMAGELEANYLCAILNSEAARARAEQYQSRGQFGARDFDKVIFNLPIPRFDAKVKLHADLAAAGARAEAAAALVVLKDGEKFQRARKRVRDALIADGVAGDIEKLVEKLLGPVAAA